MIRLALAKLSVLEETSVEDTAETIKLIVEWRGRVSILTEDDRAYASDLLKLDTDNASGLLDLYEITGPGAGWRPAKRPPRSDDDSGGDEESDDDDDDDDDGEEDDAPPGWPLLSCSQDEVDSILFRALGPHWQPPLLRNSGNSGGHGHGHGDDTSEQLRTERSQRQRRRRGAGLGSGGALASPLATSWVVESRQRRVVRVACSHEGLTGSLPQSLRQLRHLEALELPCLRPWYSPEGAHELIPRELKPKLAKDIATSASLGFLPMLRKLNLHGNLLTGPIPPNLGRLALMEDLDLSRNSLTGSVPGGLGALPNLTNLDLGENQLDGNFEAAFFNGGGDGGDGSGLGDGGGGGGGGGSGGGGSGSSGGLVVGLRKLRRLVVCDNALNGPLFSEGFARLTALEELDLGRNFLTGIVAVELPSRLGRRLRLLDLSGNLLRGRLPGTVRDLTSCERIDLSGNLFEGRLPLGLACCKTLTFLDVSGNRWSPEEASELGEFLRERLHVAAPNVFV